MCPEGPCAHPARPQPQPRLWLSDKKKGGGCLRRNPRRNPCQSKRGADRHPPTPTPTSVRGGHGMVHGLKGQGSGQGRGRGWGRAGNRALRWPLAAQPGWLRPPCRAQVARLQARPRGGRLPRSGTGGGWRKKPKSQSRSAGLWVRPAPVLLSSQVGGRARGELPGHSLDHTAAWTIAGCSLVPFEGAESQPAFHLASVGIKILGHEN